QAEDGIRDFHVTGVQTCALPIYYLKETKILDYSNVSIQELLEKRGWKDLDTVSRVKAIYNFVRDEIKFGYNVSDDIPASEILKRSEERRVGKECRYRGW